MKNRMNREKGMTIVEASIVFPVMFLVIFLMIFAGNAYLQKCKVESYVDYYAIMGASYCADPLLKNIEQGKIPNHASHNVYPYRYILTGEMRNIESEIKTKLEANLRDISSGVFKGMKPSILSTEVKYNNGFIYSTFSVEAQYKVKIPIKLLWAKDYIYMTFASRMDMPVSDATEFIRNADMIEDYMQKTGALGKIEEFMGKAKEWMGLK